MLKSQVVLSIAIYLSCILLCFGYLFEEEPSSDQETGDLETFPEQANIKDNVQFYLYTRNNSLKFEQIQLDLFYYLKWTNFNPERPIKILVHGWKCSYRSAFNVLLKNAYLTHYDVNVIVVNWHKYSQLNYVASRNQVNDIAEVVAELVDKLVEYADVSLDNIHIIGHSLGAHVAGIAGLKTNGKVYRITGLDPAGPFFSINDTNRISTESAKFVDIMHTSGRIIGFYDALGHVDFYPNEGTAIQPGCGLDFTRLRSHRRAYWLFAESIITPEGFQAVNCDNWSNYMENKCEYGNKTVMGEHVSPDARGNYYLRTNDETPFALESFNKTNIM